MRNVGLSLAIVILVMWVLFTDWGWSLWRWILKLARLFVGWGRLYYWWVWKLPFLFTYRSITIYRYAKFNIWTDLNLRTIYVLAEEKRHQFFLKKNCILIFFIKTSIKFMWNRNSIPTNRILAVTIWNQYVFELLP